MGINGFVGSIKDLASLREVFASMGIRRTEIYNKAYRMSFK
jgi:hypothetical protein